ncbi:MAG: NAD(P)-dependent oxidoreductase [Nanoarchaeota archaeon]
MKRGFIYELEDWEIDYLKPKLKEFDLRFSKDKLGSSSKIKEIDFLGIFIHSSIGEKVLDTMPNLKFITTMSTGFNHIDFEACRKRGIIISNVPSYGENTVAEHTFGLMLTLSRKLNLAVESTRKSNFDTHGLMGFDLKGKTLGVIGAGHIGMHVVNMARAFGMHVLVFTRTKDRTLENKLGFRYVSLNEILEKSDILSLHVPLTRETKNIIDIKAIKKMKRGSYLINTARGELIDTKALLYGLKEKIIAGAALDVIEGEESLEEHRRKSRNVNAETRVLLERLHKYNVIVTPHCAFETKEAIQRILDTTILNIKAYSRGKPENVVSI